MQNILRDKKGITLVSMVITIILLLILAGVSIRTLGGENGLITKTKIAKEENLKSGYKEKLSIAKTEAIVEKGGQDITLDEYIEQIKADKIEGIKSIEKITNDKASVITKEGYIFIITVNTIEYYENENTLPEMNIKDANIEFSFEPNTWTNGNVEVTVSKKENKYTIQLSRDTKKWATATSITFEENGEIYARLIDEIGRTSDVASRKISIIDKEKPVITELTPSTNSVRIKATDNAAGIIGYAVTTTNTESTEFTKCERTTELDTTVENLKQGTTYYTWVKDAAGNVSESKETSTGSVTGLTISGNTNNWSTSKTITITAGNTNYSQIRYTTDGTIPTSTTGTAYTAAFTITKNCTITAIAFDSTGQAGSAATNKITTVDATAPTIGSITGAFTIVSGNTGTITVTGISDTGGSGLSGYHINTTGTKPTSSNTWKASTSNSITYSVTSAGTYYFWIRDNAGNISAAKSCKVSVATAIAKVGNTYYSSLENAISSISSSGTITVLKDENEYISINAGKNITIDFNGKTHKGHITNRGTCVLRNGNINYTGSYAWIIYNQGGSMAIINMTITDSASGDGATVLNKEGTLNISNSKITSAENVVVTYGRTDSTGRASTAIVGSTITSTGGYYTIATDYYAYCNLLDCTTNGSYRIEPSSKVIEVNRFSGGFDLKTYGSGTFYYPTWTNNNGQDDLIWHKATSTTSHNSTCGYYRITKGEHKNETGEYIVHIYYENGNTFWAGISVNVY